MKWWGSIPAIIFWLSLISVVQASEVVVYESDFSSDPGWITDQPNNFYWDADNEWLFIHASNTVSSTTPDRYFYLPLNDFDPNQSFTLSWRQNWLTNQGVSVASFGLYTPELTNDNLSNKNFPRVYSPSTFNLSLLRNSGGSYEWQIIQPNGTLQTTSNGQGGTWRFSRGDWYEATLAYDASSTELHLLVVHEDTGTVELDRTRQSAEQPAFANTMQYLGVALYPQGRGGTPTASNPTGYSEFVIDDVRLVQTIPAPPEPEVDPLILEYAPVLYLHPQEVYQPMNVEAFIEASALWDQSGGDAILAPAGSLTMAEFDDIVVFEDTEDYYLAFSDPAEPKSLDLANASTTYHDLVEIGAATTTVYYSRMTDSYIDGNGEEQSYTVLQYWFFYAMNNWGEYQPFANNHEGDWESVFIFLEEDTQLPRYVAYSAHHNDGDPFLNPGQLDSVRRAWDSSDVTFDNDQVVSFVSLGSHANYADNGEGGSRPGGLGDDLTSFDGEHVTFSNFAEINIGGPTWMFFEGKWGADSAIPFSGRDGPLGPNYITVGGTERFHNPLRWAGVDRITETVILDPVTTVPYLEEQVELQFSEPVPAGTEFSLEPYQELVTFGLVPERTEILPQFWDIESSLENETFFATVTLPYDSALAAELGGTPTALFFNPETVEWEVVPSTVTTDAVFFTTTHFSRYAVGLVTEVVEPTLEELLAELKTIIEASELDQRRMDRLLWAVARLEYRLPLDSERDIRRFDRRLDRIERRVNRYTSKGKLSVQNQELINDLIILIRGKLST